jgi:thioredoxin-related protein
MGHMLYAQSDQINWVNWDQAQVLMQKEKRKVLVDVYTHWCGWCKRMDATTFRDPRIVKYVNKNYYAVKFNAEQAEDIHFKSKPYKFIQQGRRGVHQLAVEITNGQLSYPTFVFMDENLNTIQPLPGYQDADTFEIITNYFGGNYYKNTPYSTFEQSFRTGNKKH